ncbi:terminase [Zooshikella marina]|uniref:terminase n=1 Tax=Zooshikella ganghwensis TaxID=202772 RepID=UPI001BAF4E2F|nr:terminase [Zooshikella ganghwensis]MBU2708887.1 terminase [Zooshikella ganghwensis]
MIDYQMQRLDFEAQLRSDIAGFYADPLGHVMYVYPWGEKGTALENEDGPDKWQRKQLSEIGAAIRDNPLISIRDAISSGHGVGKSAEVAWIAQWAMSTRPHLAGVITANTENQLNTKTWRELSIWHNRSINSHWFQWTATRYYHVNYPSTWAINAVPWSINNSEAFAGLHAEHVLMIFDEASAIPDCIWEVAEGAMTTKRAHWLVFGNPTRNSGRFRQCFTKYSHRWATRQVDSRTCKMTDKEQLQEWEEDYGEDSDFFRVRVKGEFPKQAANELINSGNVLKARKRTLLGEVFQHQPVVIGVDPARFGDDKTVIIVRQGRKILHVEAHSGLRTTQTTAHTIALRKRFAADAIFVDGIGIGAGVVDELVDAGEKVFEVTSSESADEPKKFFNKRAENWYRMSKWFDLEVDIPDIPEFTEHLCCMTYSYDYNTNQLKLPEKKDIKKELGFSPDYADALSMTFDRPIAAKELRNNSSYIPQEHY